MLLFALGKLPTEQLEVDFRDVEYFVACRWVRGYINSFAYNGVQLLDDLRGVCAIAVFLQGIIEKGDGFAVRSVFLHAFEGETGLVLPENRARRYLELLAAFIIDIDRLASTRPYFSQIPLRF